MRLFAIVFALFAACGGVPEGPPWIELGETWPRFQPLTDGAPVTLVMGPQGGYHVWLSALAGNVSPIRVRLRSVLEREDATPVSDRVDILDLEHDAEAGGLVLDGVPLMVPFPEMVMGRGCTIRVELNDQAGRVASATRQVVVHRE